MRHQLSHASRRMCRQPLQHIVQYAYGSSPFSRAASSSMEPITVERAAGHIPAAHGFEVPDDSLSVFLHQCEPTRRW